MGVMAKAALYWRTARHLRPSQMAWRARYALRRRLGLFPRIPLPEEAPVFSACCLESLRFLAQCWACHHPPSAGEIGALRTGQLAFLQCAADTTDGLPWHREDFPRLWRYHLHSFDYVRVLALANADAPGAEDGQRVLDWIRDWIARNPPGTDVAWDAYPLAARLMNWALAAAVFHLDDALLRRSFQQQTAFLVRSLEYDLLANHLLQNAAGLVVGGRLLGEGECVPASAHASREARRSALAIGMSLFDKQLKEQLLADGGHFERSPMYHCHVLEYALIVYASLEDKAPALRSAIAGMCTFLDALCHPDGDIPLFGDAALGVSTPPRALAALARELTGTPANEPSSGCYAMRESGFYVLGPRDCSARMIVKAGAPGPAYQLGHAHCDMVSYEFTVGTQRVIVDSGVHGYEGSPWREYCRSTRAHNTVSVDGREQMECWAAFRVARRYVPVLHQWGEDPAGCVIDAGHNGFQPFRHDRRFLFHRGGFWIIADTVSGPGCFEAESFIHVHPSLEVVVEDEGWALRGSGVDVAIIPFGVAEARVVCGEREPFQGWYCPEFGEATPAPVLVLRGTGPSHVRFGYAIVPFGARALSADEIQALLPQGHKRQRSEEVRNFRDALPPVPAQPEGHGGVLGEETR